MQFRLTLAVSLIALNAGLASANQGHGQASLRGTRTSSGTTGSQTTTVATQVRQSGTASNATVNIDVPGGTELVLAPRRPLPKRASAVTVDLDDRGDPFATGQVIVKFLDSVRMRAPRAPIDRPFSLESHVDADRVAATLARHGLRIQQWLNRSPQQLRDLEERAALQSGIAQPDLAGFLMVDLGTAFTADRIQDVARDLQSLDCVEFAWIDRPVLQAQCGPQAEYDPPFQPPTVLPFCNVPSPSCTDVLPPPFPATPNQILCNDIALPADERQGQWGCSDAPCCDLVGSYLPYCTDEEDAAGWDIVCAAYANLLCEGTIYTVSPPSPPLPQRYDPCFVDPAALPGVIQVNPLFEPLLAQLQPNGCLTAHTGRGCDTPACCFEVCSNPSYAFCCEVEWDSSCATYAASLPNCSGVLQTGQTPVYADLSVNSSNESQWLTSQTVPYPFGNPPPIPLPVWPEASSYDGFGLDVEGLQVLQQQIAQFYPDLAPARTNGAGINIAVIDDSAYVSHEDFLFESQPQQAIAEDPNLWPGSGLLLDTPKVLLEPNQTLLLIPGVVNPPNNLPDHGTACLGIAVAARQQPVDFGIRGVACEAQGWLFPRVSIEEGPRTQNAFISAAENLGAGDVIFTPFWFGAGRTVASEEPYNAIIKFAADLGITTVVAAGNSAVSVRPQPLDSGAIVVGASSPGHLQQVGPGQPPLPSFCQGSFTRSPSSNFSDPESDRDPDTGWPLASVDVSGWGSAVFTLGGQTAFGFTNVAPSATTVLPPNTTNGNPPASGPQGLQGNKLRTYQRNFNGTSAAVSMMAGVVANIQAMSTQIYDGPLSSIQVRELLSLRTSSPLTNQCGNACSPDGLQLSGDLCQCGENCEEFNSIGNIMPPLRQAGLSLFGGDFLGGNRTKVRVLTGFVMPPSTESSFFIRALDRNYLRLGTEQASAGQQVQGLAYLMSGNVTDVVAGLNSDLSSGKEVNNLRLRVQGRVTHGLSVVCGFMFNFRTGRYDFIGVGFYDRASEDDPVDMPIPDYSVQDYFGPGGDFEARVWTCNLGLASPFQVWHDVIEIGVNDSVKEPPNP